MIETRTTWDDSGFDCDHCGGQIFSRTDYESGQQPHICYQCRECGCQWTLKGDVQRVGKLSSCRVAQRRRVVEEDVASIQLPRWAWAILLVLFILTIVRFGGLVALRFLVPVVLAGFAFFYVYRFGREKQWW